MFNATKGMQMTAPTSKQRRAAKQRDSLGWQRNKAKDRVRALYVGAIVRHAASNRLGTITEIYSDQDCMTRAKVQHFNGEAWDWNYPVSLLEEIA
jgi:putative ribosome biogenesis GTPase RsgA